MLNTKMFRDIVEQNGMKYNFIAKSLGITPQSLNLKIKNEREFTASEIGILCRLFRIDDIVLLEKIFFLQ